MPGVSLADLSPPFGVDLGNVCVVMGWFSLPRLRIERDFRHPREGGRIEMSVKPGDGDLRDAASSSLVITALDGENEALAVEAALIRIHETVGLLSAVESMVLVLEHVENYQLSLEDGTFYPASSLLADQLWWYDASTAPDARARWRLAEEAVESHADSERIRLSLRWLDEGKRSTGVDALIRLWFALEILSGGGKGDNVVKIVRDKLAAIYGVPADEATRRFGVGRIYGLRNLIVHKGLRVEVPGLLLACLHGIYVDILVLELGFQSGRRAQAALDEAGGIAQLLPSAVNEQR
jgi:hypothetical protein